MLNHKHLYSADSKRLDSWDCKLADYGSWKNKPADDSNQVDQQVLDRLVVHSNNGLGYLHDFRCCYSIDLMKTILQMMSCCEIRCFFHPLLFPLRPLSPLRLYNRIE